MAAAVAVAAPTKRYDLLYTWETSVQRVLSYQGKLGRVSGLPNSSQLQVVGMGRGYGLVHPARTSLARAKAMAARQKAGLRRAGLKDPQTVAANGYQRLYHIRYARGSNLQQLSRDRGRIGAKLGTQVADRLVIEKLDARTHAIVYRCWANKNAAQQLAGKHRTLLRAHKLTPAVVAAAVRPAVSDASGLATVATPAKGQDKGQARAAVAVPPSTAARTEGPVKARAPVATQVHVAEVRTGQGKKAAPAVPEAAVVPAATAGLNGDLQSFLRKQQARGRLGRNDSTALVAYDLTSNTYLASHNAQRSFQAASMIKPFVALAFFHQVDKGKLKYTAKHRQMMERMIQHSDNGATNWFLRQVGGPARCQALLRKEYGPLVRHVSIREYIPAGGKTYKNSANPKDYVEYLKALWKHRLPYSKEMLRVMALPGRDRIYCGTKVPKGTRVYNKTGTTAHLCGDMGILVPPGKRQAPYIIVGIVQRPSRPKDFKHWMVSGGNVIRDFSTLVYREMQDRYNFL
jgi:beta-lactamase class A